MAKKKRKGPAPFYRKQTGSFYVELDGRFVPLGKDEAEAHKRFRAIMYARDNPSPVPMAGPGGPMSTPGAVYVLPLFDQYLSHVKANKSARTYEIYRSNLQIFIRSIPKDLTIGELKPFHLTSEANRQDWADNTRRQLIVTCQGALAWCVRQGLIDRSPLAGMEKPAYVPGESVVSEAEWAAIMAARMSPNFRDLLTVTYELGARPAEVVRIEARHVEGDRIVFKSKESKGGKFQRIIYMGSSQAREIVARLAALHPVGPILVSKQGNPWNRCSICNAMRRLEKKIGFRFQLGSLRKSFATDSIRAGVDALTVAHLMGHKDTAMIAKVYARLAEDQSHMMQSAGRARSPKVKPSGDAT